MSEQGSCRGRIGFALTMTILALAIFAEGCSDAPESHQLVLPDTWKFIPGDDLSYANPATDDSGWQTVDVTRNWEHQGYGDLDGFAWYRLAFTLPVNLREDAYMDDSLVMILGKIDDFDQVYLNGQMLGENGRALEAGSMPGEGFNQGTSPWNTTRKYVVPTDDPRLKWGQENRLAVRVFDWGGLGGMFGGGLIVRMKDIDEYLLVEFSADEFDLSSGEIARKARIINTSATLELEGSLQISLREELTGKIRFQDRFSLSLSPGEAREVPVVTEIPDIPVTLEVSFRHDGSGITVSQAGWLPYLCTPVSGEAPRINGARITGARTGKPFLFKIPVTGARPLAFEASGLPEGLTLDPVTGIISGSVSKAGAYPVEIRVTNNAGSDNRQLDIRIGEHLALTPPMGWNSWNCWGLSVTQDQVLASARAFVEHGLADHGWTYINIDDGWEIPGDDPRPKRDGSGNIIVNEKFPDMKALGDSIHALGLKFGIYSSPGPLTCGGYTASYGYEQNDAASYAAWGVDYLKYDWCSYGQIAPDRSLPELKKPYFVMREALDKVDRDIVYSLCQYGMGDVWQWGAEVGGNLWRTTGDIVDTWESMSGIGFGQVDNTAFAGPGHWNDPDMLVVGWVGWGPSLHQTRLTPSEQYTHISLWCLLSSPLLLGCDLERLDPFMLNLITNDEVLAINQDPAGKQAIPVVIDGEIQVWKKELADGGHTLGIFNLGDGPVEYPVPLHDAGLQGEYSLRDLWRQKDLGTASGHFKAAVPSHGVMLVRLTP